MIKPDPRHVFGMLEALLATEPFRAFTIQLKFQTCRIDAPNTIHFTLLEGDELKTAVEESGNDDGEVFGSAPWGVTNVSLTRILQIIVQPQGDEPIKFMLADIEEISLI